MSESADLARQRYLEDTTLRRLRVGVVDFIRRRPLGTIGAAIILVMIAAAVFADVVAPYGPYEGSSPDCPRRPSPRTCWAPTRSAGMCCRG